MISEVRIRQEVVLGIVDHFKRNKVQKLFASPTVFGGIQGRVSGSTVSFEKVFEVPFKEDQATIDEDFITIKLEMEKQVNPELDLVGFYITDQSLEAGRSVENTYQVFHKKSELLYALVFNPLAKVTKEQGLPLKVYEMAAHEKKFKTVQNTLVADPGEVICINDLLKEVAGASSSESGYAKGMKGWQNSFQNYIEKLQVIEKRLRAGGLSKEELRQVKEIIINFPSSFAEDNSATLEEKFITANIVNLMTSVYKFSRTQDKTLNLIPAPSK